MINLFLKPKHISRISTLRNFKNYPFTISFLIGNKLYLEKNMKDAKYVIPLGIQCQSYLSTSKYKVKTFVCDDPEVYKLLNNKNNFYILLKQLNVKTKLIPTYGANNSDIFGSFIIKKVNGAGSYNTIIRDDFLHNILSRYDPEKYQIQKYVGDLPNVVGVTLFAIQGRIKNHFSTLYHSNKDLLNTDRKEVIYHVPKYIMDDITRICEYCKYSGVAEFEFIKQDGELYFMECNPRISGKIISINSNDEDIYYEFVIKNYIRANIKLNILDNCNDYIITLGKTKRYYMGLFYVLWYFKYTILFIILTIIIILLTIFNLYNKFH